MAAPRVFLSSTFYDLRHVRSDLERFIRDLGYEPVLHERGAVPYGSDEALEEYCYREIGLCDILVAVVGGRFGSRSRKDEDSVSQRELKTALKLGRQVYIFVDKAVLNEYRTWELNKENKETKYHSVDSVRVFEFLADLYQLPQNNSITSFENTIEIALFLKAQWAGLFQRLLTNAKMLDQAQSFQQLTSTVNTLERLVELLAANQQSQSEVVNAILLINHPAFAALRTGVGIPMRIAFYNESELADLMAAYRFKDYHDDDDADYLQWTRTVSGGTKGAADKRQFVMVRRDLFDPSGALKPMKPGDWTDDHVRSWVVDAPQRPTPSPFDADDDELPF